jgi:hypothetical protein
VDFEDYGSLETLLRNLSNRGNLDRPHADFHFLTHSLDSKKNQVGTLGDEGCELILMRGFPYPGDLDDVFHETKVDIALFRRHFHFLASIPDDDDPDPATHHASHALPRLPSDHRRVFTLHVPSIRKDGVPSRDTLLRDLKDRRKQAREKLKIYQENLALTANAGDSLVRDYHVVTQDVSIVEPSISVGLVKDTDHSWKGQ